MKKGFEGFIGKGIKPKGKPPKPTAVPPQINYEQAVKAREVWFKELLEMFLPEVLNKLVKRGTIKI